MNFENDLHENEPPDHEISLGTVTIIGIFLALALICAAFFGFGYSMGRHSAPAVVAVPAEPKADAETNAKPDTTFSNFKTAPSAGESQATEDTPSAKPIKRSAPQPAVEPVASMQPATEDATAKPVRVPLPPTNSGGQFVVQVSATTRQSDADSLLAALKHKGYTANIRQEADNRFHVQVGPFASKADAETTRKQLNTDGYKGPFIK